LLAISFCSVGYFCTFCLHEKEDAIMDKRLFLLLLCAYICVAGFLLVLIIKFTKPVSLSSYAGLASIAGIGGLLVGIFGVFIVIGLSGIFSIFAITVSVLKYEVMDFRYFTRCFIYRVAFLLWSILIVFAIFRMAQTVDPDHTGDVMWPIIPTLVASMALQVTTSLHVISGLAACRKQKTITGGEFSSHVTMQFFCGFDFISSLVLMFKEMEEHPNERVGFLRHVFMKRTKPD
jgi:hypothetical protein